MATTDLIDLAGYYPEVVNKYLVRVPPQARGNGTRIVAGRGAGKSRLVGRFFMVGDLLSGTPQIVIDPLGSTADNFLHKVTLMPLELQNKLWGRIKWIDMAGNKERVAPFPLLYRQGDEPLYTMTQRYIETIRRLDPNLANAAIQGLNPFADLAESTGMLLSAMGYQYTEAAHMVQHPELWEGKIRAAVAENPHELSGPASFILDELAALDKREKATRTSSFLRKMRLLEWNPVARAMFGATTAAVSWEEVAEKRQTVILDFRHVTNGELRRFGMLWVFNSIMEYIKSRPPKRSQQPLAFTIDEITYLLGSPSQPPVALQGDLRELIDIESRNKAIWLTIMHQELNQVHPDVRRTLMTMGNQFFGWTSDPESASDVSGRYYDWDPTMIKKTENVWATIEGVPQVIDYRTQEYSIEEQRYLKSRQLLKLPRFTYLAAIGEEEGTPNTDLRNISIDGLDPYQYADADELKPVRKLLMERDGVSTDELLAAIAHRLPGREPERLTNAPAGAATALPLHERRVPRRSR